MFRIVAGAAHLQEFTKAGGTIMRAFCRECGTRVLNRFGSWKPGGRVPLAFFPNLLNTRHQHPLPAILRPTRNNRPEECVLDAPFLRAMPLEG